MIDAIEARVQPLSPHIGAVLSGVQLGERVDSGDFAHLAKALLSHLVVIAEDQRFTAESLRELVSKFGPIHTHHDDVGVLRAPGVPDVLELRRTVEDTASFGGADWHADVTFENPAGYVTALYAETIPSAGGDTLFASTIAAFAALGDTMQDLLRGLEAVHSYDGPGLPERHGLSAIHPVVRTHPDTGEEGIYLNRMFVTRFVGMSEYESRPLIDFVARHMTRPEFTCRVGWQPRQVVFWDNRFTLHYPINDFVGQERLLLRCVALES